MDLAGMLNVIDYNTAAIQDGLPTKSITTAPVAPTAPATPATPATPEQPNPDAYTPHFDKYSAYVDALSGMAGSPGAVPLVATADTAQAVEQTGQQAGNFVGRALDDIGHRVGPYLADGLAVACGLLCIVLGGYALFSGGGGLNGAVMVGDDDDDQPAPAESESGEQPTGEQVQESVQRVRRKRAARSENKKILSKAKGREIAKTVSKTAKVAAAVA